MVISALYLTLGILFALRFWYLGTQGKTFSTNPWLVGFTIAASASNFLAALSIYSAPAAIMNLIAMAAIISAR